MKLTEWMDREVYPALFDQLPQLFAGFGWRGDGTKLVASSADTTKGLPGAPKPKQVVAYANRPHGFFVHGGAALTFVRWVDYVAGRPGGPLDYEAWATAAKELATLVGRPFPQAEATPEQRRRDEAEEWRERCLEAFLDLTRRTLSGERGTAALGYLERRGFTRTQAETLDFGLCPGGDEVARGLREQGLPQEVIEQSGLLRDGRWAGRLVGPWRDARGRIGTLWARSMAGDTADHEKYLYLTSEPTGFGKRKADLVAFGLDVALQTAEGRRNLVVVEGLMDALKPQANGFTGVAAIGGAGSELSAARLEALHRLGVQAVTLLLDNDPKPDGRWPGREGTLAAIANATKAEGAVPEVYVVDPAELAPAKDLDEFVSKRGIEAIRPILERRVHAYRFKARNIVERNRPVQGWTDVAREAVLTEAKAFGVACPRSALPELDVHFWSEIQAATGASREALNGALTALRGRRDHDDTRHALEGLHRSLGQAIEEGALDRARYLVVEEAPRIVALEHGRPPDPVRSLAGELEDHRRYLDRFRGRPSIGLLQKTLAPLDQATLGLRGLMLLAAAPNVGKTALAVQLGVDVVRNDPNACFVFLSLEMPRMEILSRLKSRLAKLPWKQLVLGDGAQGNILDRPLRDAEAELARWGHRVLILDERNCPEPTVERVLAHVAALKAETGATHSLVLVDYLQVWPVPAAAARSLRSELDVDKWRIGQMKTLRDATDGDAVLVISEARKPSGTNDRTPWAAEMADVMGSARGIYTPDMVFLLLPFKDAELAIAYKLPTDDTDRLDFLKDQMNAAGVTHAKLKIVKGRDGVERASMDLTFWYRQARFEPEVVTSWRE